jgi:hypothetical protein
MWPTKLDQAAEVEHGAPGGVDGYRERFRVGAVQREVGPQGGAEYTPLTRGVDQHLVVQHMHVVDRCRRVVHRRFQRTEFPVVVFVIARDVDDRHGAVEGLRGPARSRCVIVDVAGKHDQVRRGMRNHLGLVALQMQIGQHTNLHDSHSSQASIGLRRLCLLLLA